MDSKQYLREQIKKCKRKMNIAKLIDFGILFAAAGGIFGMFFELSSLIWQFYYVNIAVTWCFVAGLLTGIGYALYKRADMKQAARRLDFFGLKERMLTAYENMDKEDEFAKLQRQDALVHYNRICEQVKIPLLPDKRHILALFVSVAAVIGMSFIPSPVRDQARLHHQVQEQAKEEQEELEELLEALEGVDMESLTEEQKAQLQEMVDAMKLSQEELAKTNSWESLSSAMEKLDYKYQQAAQSLENLAAQISNPDGAGVADAEMLAKAAANRNGQQMVSSGATASSGTPGGSPGEGQGGENGSGEGSGQGGENGSGEGSGQGGENGSGEGSGQGEGNGSGNGSGQGEGNGSGNGNEQGGGSGTGNGRGTGSSDAAHDYVSIPNAIANDPSLTGNKNGEQDSDYYRQQNGLAWEGEHVDYNSVISEYTDSAYEGIANGRYPSGMESVIRDYFENLNK